MDSNFNISGFLQTLQQNQPRTKEMTEKTRSLEKLYLSYPGNYGRYQIFPMNSVITGFPLAYLNGTREVKMLKKNTLPDGTENVFDAWIKILPNEAYKMLDSSGRIVSSLTTEDENLLIQARTVFDALYDELGGNIKEQPQGNPIGKPGMAPGQAGLNKDNPNKAIGYLRKRNYTVFHGKCLNKWSMKDNRTPERTGFAALFVCTAKGFSQVISDNINDGTISHNGDQSWLEQVYNRSLDNRSGYLIFSIAMGINGKVGYSITATHESDRGQYLKDYFITEEEADLMQDPVETFLGWQGGHEPGRLFNKGLIQESISHMSQQLAAVRMAKSTGADLVSAIEATNQEALRNQPVYGEQPKTNDPIMAQQYSQGMAEAQRVSENVYSQNNDPYATPPAAHIDPITTNPIPGGGWNQSPSQAPQQAAPYNQPEFAKGFQQPNPFGNPGFGQQPNPSGPVNNPFGN